MGREGRERRERGREREREKRERGREIKREREKRIDKKADTKTLRGG